MMVGLGVFELLTSRNCCHGHNREEISPEGVDRKTLRGLPVSPSQTGHKGDQFSALNLRVIVVYSHKLFIS